MAIETRGWEGVVYNYASSSVVVTCLCEHTEGLTAQSPRKVPAHLPHPWMAWLSFCPPCSRGGARCHISPYLVCVTSPAVSAPARDVEGTAPRSAAPPAPGVPSFLPAF